MKKQLFSLLLVGTLLSAWVLNQNVSKAATSTSVGSVTEDITNDTKIGHDVTQSKTSTYSSDLTLGGTENVEVYASQGSTFSVKIPKVIILDGANGNGAYSVAVKGNIASNQSVHVTPPEDFKLSDQSKVESKKNDIKAILTQKKNTWQLKEVMPDKYTYTTGSIAANDISAGIWFGAFNFTITLTD